MKNVKRFAGIFLVLAAFAFTSCENEPIDSAINLDDFENPTNSGSGTFTAKIGGESFVAQQIVAELSGSAFGPELNVVGMVPGGKMISFQLINPALGTWQATTAFENLLLFQYNESLAGAGFTSFNSTTSTSTGSITITQFDSATKKLSATFSFTGYNSSNSSDTRQITEGVVNNVTFTVAP